MKLLLNPPNKKTVYLIASLCLFFGALPVATAGSRDLLFPGGVRPSGLDYRTELPQGYLTVYSATDWFDDAGVPYNPHSSYSIYTTDGKWFKNVENHIAPSDDSPETVTLPAGSYMLDVRSEKDGFVRVHVVIASHRRTVLILDRKSMSQSSRLRARRSSKVVMGLSGHNSKTQPAEARLLTPENFGNKSAPSG